MADARDGSRLGLNKVPDGVGQATHFLSASRSFRNGELNDDVTSSTTYYSTAPQELWTELLPEYLQHQNLALETESVESGWVQVLGKPNYKIRHDEIYLERLLAEGGEAHVYSATLGGRRLIFVCKRFKHQNVSLFRLQRRMALVMKVKEENNSAICGVYGAGLDPYGNVLLLMERMAGDLRTLIDDRMNYLTDGQMPFEYTQTITVMIRIAEGMKDLHRCDIIHGDLKASNILVGWGSTNFDVKIGDFDNCDGVQGTAFWRAPEVLQAVKNRTKPMFSPAVDVYSYAMLCYELLTGHIPLRQYRRGNYDVVLSGERPQLPAHVNDALKTLLHACWRAEAGERPGWTYIIQTLQLELQIHPLKSHIFHSCTKMRKLERLGTPNEVDFLTWRVPKIPWEEACARQLYNREEGKQFITWKEKTLPNLLPQILPTVAAMQESFNLQMAPSTLTRKYLSMLCVWPLNAVWREVQDTWTNHVCQTANVPLSYYGVSMFNASEPCNLLGSTAKQWLEEIFATSENCKKLRAHRRWSVTLRKLLFAWESVYITFHDWHFESTIAFVTWQVVDEIYLHWTKPMRPSTVG
jgi:serine/threonine protein kinase